MNEQGFNLLRLNCLLSDSKLSNQESLIKSLVCDYLYVENNQPQPVSALFSHIVDNYHVPIIWDEFNRYIISDSRFIVDRNAQEPTVSLEGHVYSIVQNAVAEGSVEKYIDEFLMQRNYPSSYKDVLIDMLYQSIYLNVSYFDTKNLRSIIPVNIEEQFNEKHIAAFNDFLDESHEKKNNSIYQLFLKAIQFALLTSGKAAHQYSQNFFKQKKYYLDSNTIFRILGIGGKSRQKGLEKLLSFCAKHGVQFSVSEFSYFEFRQTVKSNSYLISQSNKESINLAVKAGIEPSNLKITDGFIKHFIEIKSVDKAIQTGEQYGQYLELEFERLCGKFNVDIEYHSKRKFRESDVEKVSAKLLEGKRFLHANVRYSMKAAKVDAQNVLYIRELRGSNDYNFQSIKYFYLTTDGLLNRVLQGQKKLTAESILPSQLYLIHTGLLSEENAEPDYDLFVSFLKRRTSMTNISGQDLVRYVDEVRKFTTHPPDVKIIVEGYLNIRYAAVREGKALDSEKEVESIMEYAKSYLQRQIDELEPSALRVRDMYKSACERIPRYCVNSKRLTILVDLVLYLIIAIVAFYVGTLINLPKFYLYALVALFELLKLFHSKSNGMRSLKKWIFYKYVRSDPYYKAIGDEPEYIEKAKEVFLGC